MLRHVYKSPVVDRALNVLFAAWVVYFLATGNIVPEPLLRDRPPPMAAHEPGQIEADHDSPSPAHERDGES